MAGKLGNLIIGIGLDLKGLSKDLNRVSYKLNRQASKLKSAGSAMSSAITLPLLAIGATGIKMSLDLEKSLNKITNLVGVSSGDLAKYKKDLVIISNETGKSQTELAKALFDLTSAGLSGDKALAALRKSAKASAIGLGETQVVASAVSSAMNAYESSSLSAAKATEVLAATVRFGKLSAEELAPAIGQVLPIASAMGVTFDEVGANIATFTRLGIDSKQAATALKSLLSGFSGAAGKKAADALDSIGLSMDGVRKKIREDGLLATLEMLNEKTGGNVETLSAIIPNIRAFSNVLGTVGAQGDTYREVLDGIEKSQTLVADGFDKVKQSAGFKLTKAINELKNVGIQIGDILLPFVIKFAKVLSNLVKKFNDLSTPIKSTIVLIGLIVSAIGPLLLIVGTLLSSFAAITTTLGITAGSIGSFIALFSGFGAIVGLLGGLVYGINKVVEIEKDALSIKDRLIESEKEYNKQIVEEKTNSDNLFRALDDCNVSLESKKVAYEKLLSQYPDIMKNYKLENGELLGIEEANDKVTASIRRKIKEQIYSQKAAESIQKQTELQKKLTDIEINGYKESQGFFGTIYENIKNTFEARKEDEKLLTQQQFNEKRLREEIEAKIKVEEDYRASIKDKVGDTELVVKATKELTAAEIELAKIKADQKQKDLVAVEAQKGSLKELRNSIILQTSALEKSTSELSNLENGTESYNKKLEDTKKLSRELIDLKIEEEQATKNLNLAIAGRSIIGAPAKIASGFSSSVGDGDSSNRASIDNAGDVTPVVKEAKEAVIELEDSIKGGLVESMSLLGESFGSILSGTVSFSDGMKNLGKGLLGVLAGVLEKVGKAIVAAGLGMDALKKTLNFGNPFAAIAAGIGLIAVAKITKSAIANSVPKLASGGVLTSEQLFIGGEYSGAANNPEIVTPQNIMAETFRKVLGQSGGGSGVGVLHMDTIRFGLEKDNLRVT
jgi:TP901 family phage tail tape measure protein